jgi:predicted DNA-binding transcriptional regulator YafY
VGSRQERGLQDARDYILHERGESYGDLDRKFVFAARGGESALPEKGAMLDRIVEAVLRSQRLRVEYRHNDGRLEKLEIDPLSLVVYENKFYVIVERDNGFYPYRFARFAAAEPTGWIFEYPARGQFDPHGLLAQSFGIHIHGTGPADTIEVVLAEPWGSYALAHRWHPSQRATRRDDGVLVSLRVPLCREIETWVLGFGEHARVLKPKQLRETVARRLVEAAAVYVSKPSGPSIAKAQGKQSHRSKKATGRNS